MINWSDPTFSGPTHIMRLVVSHCIFISWWVFVNTTPNFKFPSSYHIPWYPIIYGHIYIPLYPTISHSPITASPTISPLVKSPFAGKSPCDIAINWANSGLDLFNILYITFLYLSIPFYTFLYIHFYTFLNIHFYTFLYLSIPLYPTKVPGSNLPASTQQALVASPQAHAPQRPSLWPRLRWRLNTCVGSVVQKIGV